MSDTITIFVDLIVLIFALGGVCWLAEVFKGRKP